MYYDKTLMITGGTGTFGKNCTKFLLKNFKEIKKIILFSRDEYKQQKFKEQLSRQFNDEDLNKIRMIIGDVRDYGRVSLALKNVDYCLHSAALKHIDVCERNVQECIKTNVEGTINVVNASIENNLEKVVFLSSDKCVSSLNVYGNSKALAEKACIFSNAYADKTRFCAVRYGNVLNSRGSVIETFLKKRSQAYFNITDKNMTRFFLKIEEAIKMSLFALENSRGGEIFIPSIKATNIEKLALSIDPSKKIKYIGIRPGEKIHEQLANESECNRMVWNGNFFVILPESCSWDGELYDYYNQKFRIKKFDESIFVSNTAPQFESGELLSLIGEEISRIKNEI